MFNDVPICLDRISFILGSDFKLHIIFYALFVILCGSEALTQKTISGFVSEPFPKEICLYKKIEDFSPRRTLQKQL
jgi:hypothetical protein